MKLLHKGYWFGTEAKLLPDTMYSEITSYFDIIECENDISILSEPDIHLCFFFFNSDKDITVFHSLIRMCRNLNKKVIAIYTGEANSTITSASRFIYSSITTDTDDICGWAANLNVNIRLDYSHHACVRRLNHKSSTIETSAPEFEAVIRFIDSNLPSQLREEELAEKCHYSVTYFSKLFKKMKGVNFRDYVISKRISLAKQMLVEDKQTKVAVVAYQCGYKDVSYFSRIFKKKTGLTPAGYRQQY
ncbi:helix-turn-helix domain-containing protein [Vibrio astriarenae]|uniref:helix-turn-helix domain-containing protein n=1 Tax=Vibrio astriarenae TaxID=1481923 RepID=UPI003735E09B